jgi:homoserine kinase type II
MPVPNPVANVDGEILHWLKNRPTAVVNRLPGASETAPAAAHCRSVGEVLARMHLAGSDYPRHQANPRGLSWWNEVAPVVGRCVSDEQQSLLASELAFQNQIAASSAYEHLPKGPVHADLFRDNALFDGGRLTGVFDFYFAGCDALLFDIAVCLNDWCVDDRTGRQDNERAAAFLDAYESVRAPSLQPNACCFLRCSGREHFVFGYRVSGICTCLAKLLCSTHTIPAISSGCCACSGEKRHKPSG